MQKHDSSSSTADVMGATIATRCTFLFPENKMFLPVLNTT